MIPDPTSQQPKDESKGRKPQPPQVDLADAGDAGAGSAEPPRIKDVIDPHQTGKHVTSRIHLSDSQQVPGDESVPVAKPITQRIAMGKTSPIATEFGKSMTVPMDFTDVGQPAPQDALKQAIQPSVLNRTARITIEEEEVPTGGEAPKAPAAPGTVQPKTIKLQRPGTPPTTTPRTIVLKRPEQPPSQPKTVMLKRPEAGVQPKTVVLKKPEVPGSPISSAGTKGSTAKIDSAAPGAEPPPSGVQRKTIRIKRPEGGESAVRIGGASTPGMTVSGTPADFIQARNEARAALLERRRSQPGVVILITSIAASLVAAACLYLVFAHFPSPEQPMYKLTMPEPMLFVQ